MLSCFVSILVEWGGMALEIWDEPGAMHSRQMLIEERKHLEHVTYTLPMIKDKGGFIRLSHVSVSMPDSVASLINDLLSVFHVYAEAAQNMVSVFFSRLMVLFLSLPTFILFGAVGFVRGLIARDLRTWGGGRETSGTYHLALRFLPDVSIGLWVVYLAMPITVNPFYVVGPVAIGFAFVLMQLTYRFKKYV